MDKINHILDMLPKHYNKRKESSLYKALYAIADEFDIFVASIDRIQRSKYVDYATGDNLDKLGSLLSVNRLRNERDNPYRARIKSKIPSFIGGGTLNALKQVIENFTSAEYNIYEHYKEGEAIYDRFINGVFSGLEVINRDGSLVLKPGIAYIDGERIVIEEEQNINIDNLYNGKNYVYLKDDSSVVIKEYDVFNYDTEIFLIEFNYDLESDIISDLVDMRVILDPEHDFMTNKGTITISMVVDMDDISYDFEEAIRKTKAAGIAILLKFLTHFNIYATAYFNEKTSSRLKATNEIDLQTTESDFKRIKNRTGFVSVGSTFERVEFLDYIYLNGSCLLDGSYDLEGVNKLGINLYNNNADKIIIKIYQDGRLISRYEEA